MQVRRDRDSRRWFAFVLLACGGLLQGEIRRLQLHRAFRRRLVGVDAGSYPAAMTEIGSAGTLGDLLASRRRHRFVGRASEIELFRAALDSADPPFSVLYIHGPPGIGKTRLLEVVAGLAEDAGASVVRLDGRELVPSPPAVLQALGPLEVPEADGAIAGLSDRGRLVVLLDTYERLAPLDDWVRTRLLPRLPATALTVVAGRQPPGSAWHADPAWRELLRVVSLRNLSLEESRQYLQACGVDPTRHDQLVELAHGHPLGLSLLADVVGRGGEAAADPLTPDLVGTLLRQFLEVVPTGLHRRALEACALARVTTEALLRGVLGREDAHELFTWLRELSFVESGPEGLFPHDLARDALEADLRWRDPENYRRAFRGIRGHVNARLQTSRGLEQQRAIADAKYLFRRLPGVGSPVDWEAWGQQYPEPARPGDREPILDLVLAWEGPESAAVAARWLEQQPEGFFVVRGQDGTVAGVLALLDLTRASTQDIEADPGARAALGYARRRAAPRPGEVVTLSRFVIDRAAYQGPSATLNATPILTFQRYLGTPNLAWDFLALAEPERWDAYFAAADLPRATGADFWVGGRRYGLFAHDFRRVPVEALLELVTERALAQDLTPSPPTVKPPLLVLSQPEFDDSVRQALRDLRRPDLLSRNPLLRTRLVADHAADQEPSAATLEGLVGAAVEALGQHPRDDKLWRAVERTYVRPAATQERAAAALGLPFSTYRRHLTQGVDRVVAWLWDQEVYGGHR
jgi:AAA ATPase domain